MMNSIRIGLLVIAFATLAAWAKDPLPGHNAVRFYLPGEQDTAHDRADSAAGNGGPLNIVASLPATISLNGDWDFYYDGISEAKRRGVGYAMKEDVPELPTEESYETTMPVPAYWDDHLANLRNTSWWFWAQFNVNYRKIEFPMGNKYVPPFANLAYLVGTGYYRKQLYIPEGLVNKKINLCIGGVVEKAKVYLNGSRVGEKADYLTPGEVNLSGNVRAGNNELIIAVTNRDTFARGAPTSCAIDGYEGFTGGIYGQVSLTISDAPRIKDLYVRSVGDKLNWQVETDGFAEKSSLQWSIQDANSGETVLNGEITPSKPGLITWESSSTSMQRWSDTNPKLYIIAVKSVVAGKTMDVRQQKFGRRTLSIRDKNIYLNDKAMMLRGICDSWYYPKTTTAPLDPGAYVAMIKKYKALGFNWIRFHTSMPRQEYLDAADKLGMLIQVESPRGSDEQTWVSILRAARNHPSVILYCVSNEALLDEDMIATVTHWQSVMKDLVPDALFSPMEALRGVEYGAGRQDFGKDAVDEPFLHNPRRLAMLKPIADVFEPTGWSHFSFNSAAAADASDINEKLNLFDRPCLLHEVGIHGTYLDLRLTERYQGTRIGTDLYDSVRRYLDENQLLPKADVYYRNSCRWAQLARKHAIERARLCDNVKGYDLLGAVDIHWMFCGYTCGIMNEFLELKPGESARDIVNYNGESVLLLDLDTKRVFSAGDQFHVNVFASLYGEEPCLNGTLYWSAKDETGQIISASSVPVDKLPVGKLSRVTEVQFQLPKIETSSRLCITTRLQSSTYDLENRWYIWVFPRCDVNGLNFAADEETVGRLKMLSRPTTTKASQDALRVTSKLASEQVEFLKSGGRVLLLGASPFKSSPVSFQVAAAGRVIGNQATIISDHPVFSGFAHDGFCDWQFYQMLNDSEAVVFDDKRLPFDPILEVASSYKLLKRQAAIFELRVGEGLLLVCTLTLKSDDPAGQFLLHNLIQYSSSNQFRPTAQIDPAVLESLLVKESHK